MARKYSRDNRGRFAGGGGGATARGGRLRTAAGNKRKTQTMESAAKPKGTIGKPKGLKPGAIKAKATRAAAAKPRFNAAEGALRKREAAFQLSLPKDVRRIGRQARLARGPLGANPRNSINEGMTILRSNMGKRKNAMTGGAKQSMFNGLRSSSRKLKVEQAFARRGQRLGGIGQTMKAAGQGGVGVMNRRATAKPTAKPARAMAKTAPKASVKKLGSRLNPAKKADRAATKQFDKAYNREQRIRASLFSGNKTQAKKDAIAKELKKASDTTGAKLQQRREIRARSPVQSRDKALRASGIAGKKGTIIKNKDVRNQQNRKAAFVRKIERVPRASFNPSNKKERQTARVSVRARAVYQGTKRPDKSDATIGNITNARVSKGYKAPSSRLAAPSRAAIRSGKALANKATGSARDKFGRRMMNPLKGTKKARTAARALKFYKNPKATAQQVLKDQGKAGKRTKGFRLPRTMR